MPRHPANVVFSAAAAAELTAARYTAYKATLRFVIWQNAVAAGCKTEPVLGGVFNEGPRAFTANAIKGGAIRTRTNVCQ